MKQNYSILLSLYLIVNIMNNEQREYQRPYDSEVNLLANGIIPLLNNKPGNYHAYNPNY